MVKKGQSAAPKAASAAALPAAELKRMMGVLHYNSSFGKDSAKKADASAALDMWKSLETVDEKRDFMKAFEDNGNGKSKDSLKFAQSFSWKKSSKKETHAGILEDFFTR